MEEEQPATIVYIDLATATREAIEPGYYYRDDEYPDEGLCGPFGTIDDAIADAVGSGYVPVIPWMQNR